VTSASRDTVTLFHLLQPLQILKVAPAVRVASPGVALTLGSGTQATLRKASRPAASSASVLSF
jgi:hypothetical protein